MQQQQNTSNKRVTVQFSDIPSGFEEQGLDRLIPRFFRLKLLNDNNTASSAGNDVNENGVKIGSSTLYLPFGDNALNERIDVQPPINREIIDAISKFNPLGKFFMDGETSECTEEGFIFRNARDKAHAVCFILNPLSYAPFWGYTNTDRTGKVTDKFSLPEEKILSHYARLVGQQLSQQGCELLSPESLAKVELLRQAAITAAMDRSNNVRAAKYGYLTTKFCFEGTTNLVPPFVATIEFTGQQWTAILEEHVKTLAVARADMAAKGKGKITSRELIAYACISEQPRIVGGGNANTRIYPMQFILHAMNDDSPFANDEQALNEAAEAAISTYIIPEVLATVEETLTKLAEDDLPDEVLKAFRNPTRRRHSKNSRAKFRKMLKN